MSLPEIEIPDDGIIDGHCHPFPEHRDLTPEQFLGSFSLRVNGGGRSSRQFPELVMTEQMVLAMARLLGVPPVLDAVLEARASAAADYPVYVRRLFGDAGINGLVVDYGYPVPPISPEEFSSRAGVLIGRVFRLEPLILSLLIEDIGFEEFVRRYTAELAAALDDPECVAAKTIIAYRTGLEITDPSPMDAAASLEAWRRAKGCRRDPRGLGPELKALRDWCLQVSVGICHDLNKVLCIHSGAGDSEIRLQTARPHLLQDFLSSQPARDTRICLVHAGYPWTQEAAFMANVFQNLYLDYSLLVPFTSFGAARHLAEILEIAPVTRVLHGSDGFNLPEVNWLGAHLGRAGLRRALGELVADGVIRPAFARFAAERILAENARDLYGGPLRELRASPGMNPGTEAP